MFGRRRVSETSQTAPAVPEKIGGKGRPTPTRREAQAARVARAKPTRSRREALKRDRAAARADRIKSRQALMAGDEKALPARDQGPVRRHARDFVDSRRTAAEFFFWIAIVVLAGSFIKPVAAYVTLFWLIALLAIIVDSVILVFRLRASLKRRFPDARLRGTTSYALLRAMQIRRLRLPPPKVKPGTHI